MQELKSIKISFPANLSKTLIFPKKNHKNAGEQEFFIIFGTKVD